uniref:Uncharacterized protein n=1 Tax=Anguilla anguilla TaxID=7936 RepID=A0A0E9WS70_ANGAN
MSQVYRIAQQTAQENRFRMAMLTSLLVLTHPPVGDRKSPSSSSAANISPAV